MRGSWGMLLVLLGVLVLAAGWNPEILVLNPLETPEVIRPTDVSLDARGRLLVADLSGERLLVVSPEGRLEGARPQRGPLTGGSSPAPAGSGTAVAWLLGLEPVTFDRETAAPSGAEAWLDTWTGTVVWSPASGAVLRRVHRVEVPGALRAGLLLWWASAAAAAVLAGAMVLGALWRWLRQPGTVAVRLAAVALPWALATGALTWWSLEENLGPRDDAAIVSRLLLAGQAAVEGRSLPASRDWSVRIFRADQGALSPVPSGLPAEELKAALRSGLPQVVRHAGPLVLVPGPTGGDRPAAVAAVRWTGGRRGQTLAEPATLASAAGWTAASAALFAGMLWLLKRLRPLKPADPDRFLDEAPWRAFAPRQWVELLGPDVLGPLSGGSPVVRSAVLVTWTDSESDWVVHLGRWGALEVPAIAPCRRAVFPGGLRTAASAVSAWEQAGRTPPDLRIEAVRAAFGFVDTGFRQEPLVQGLPAVRPVSPGITVVPALRKRWDRLVSVANRAGPA